MSTQQARRGQVRRRGALATATSPTPKAKAAASPATTNTPNSASPLQTDDDLAYRRNRQRLSATERTSLRDIERHLVLHPERIHATRMEVVGGRSGRDRRASANRFNSTYSIFKQVSK